MNAPERYDIKTGTHLRLQEKERPERYFDLFFPYLKVEEFDEKRLFNYLEIPELIILSHHKSQYATIESDVDKIEEFNNIKMDNMRTLVNRIRRDKDYLLLVCNGVCS
ncbi:MAG: hypothetical protein ABIG84_02580 [archaeon]